MTESDIVAGLLRPYRDMSLPSLVAEMRADAHEITSATVPHLVAFGELGPDAVVCLGPFGGDARWRNPLPLIRAGLLRRLIAGQRDEPAPAVLALPGPSRLPVLEQPEVRRATARGDFTAVADAYLTGLTDHGVRRILVFGFSQGASLAAHIAAHAPRHSVQVDSLGLADPPGLRRVALPALVGRYVGEGPSMSRDVQRNPLAGYREAYRNLADGDRVRGVLGRLSLSLALGRGHSRGTLSTAVRSVLARGVPVSIAVGGASRLSPIADALAFTQSLPVDSRLLCDVLAVTGRHHGWLHDTAMYLESQLVHLSHKSAFGRREGAAPWPARIG
nr:alpha/beta hydrolase [uncultured Actinoplanes sp.]